MMVRPSHPAHYPRYVKLTRILFRRARDPLLTGLLAIQSFLLFVLPAVRAAGLIIPRPAIDAILLSVVSLAILLSRSTGAIVAIILAISLTVAGSAQDLWPSQLIAEAVSTTGLVLAQLSLIWAVSTAVFGAGPTTHHRILGAVVIYLGIGMIFVSLDLLLAHAIPGAFSHLPDNGPELRESMTYFSFSTLTTSSFGDILPVHPIARSLANIEAICGQLFPATLLARIVMLHNMKHRSS
jgi:hypothetical protein